MLTHPDDFVSFRVYIPCLYCLNKIDQITVEELDILDRIPHYVMISAHLEWNLDELLAKMWDYLGLIRMYSFPNCVSLPPYITFLLHNKTDTPSHVGKYPITPLP